MQNIGKYRDFPKIHAGFFVRLKKIDSPQKFKDKTVNIHEQTYGAHILASTAFFLKLPATRHRSDDHSARLNNQVQKLNETGAQPLDPREYDRHIVVVAPDPVEFATHLGELGNIEPVTGHFECWRRLGRIWMR